MADIAITAANVVAGNGAKRKDRTAGATITAGQVTYRDASDGKNKLADCDGAAALREPEGIALHGASNNQPLAIHTEGPLTIGGTLVPGTTYYLSPTAGGICPIADLSAGDYPTIMGIAISASVLDVKIHRSNVAI